MARGNECGHPERKHRAKGMCGACYHAARYLANPEKYRAKAEVLRKANREKFLAKTDAWTMSYPSPAVAHT